MSLDSVTLGLSPFAYYRMNETSGTTLVDSSGNALNGTYTNATLNQTPLTTNDTGSPTFTGSTSPFSHATTGVTASNTNLTGTNFSISFWLKFSTVPTFANFIGNGTTESVTSNLGFCVIKGSTTIQFAVRTSTTVETEAAKTITPVAGTLYHIVAVIDSVANQMRLVINNGTPSTATYTRQGTSLYAVTLGDLAPAGSANPFPGTVAEVALFNTALSAANVSALYTAGTTVSARRRVSDCFIFAH